MAEVYLQSPLFAELIAQKTCRLCGVAKPSEMFGPDRKTRDGLKSECRRCACDRQLRFYQENRERLLAHLRERYANEPAWKAARRDSRKRQNIEHPETVARWVKRWNEQNPEKLKAIYKRSRQAHRAERLDYGHQRRARIKGRFHEPVNRATVFERDHGICHICKQSVDPNDWHLDHVVPIARGGEHSYANVAVSHPSCNHKKWMHLLEELDLSMIGRGQQPNEELIP